MKANELRIGNLVSLNNEAIEKIELFLTKVNENVFQVTSIDDVLCAYNENVGNCEFRLSEAQSITLTEEWFIKFGFDKDELGYWTKGDSIYSFVDRGELAFMLVIADNEYKETYIKHVHRLQNLWFTLTSEELTIKE